MNKFCLSYFPRPCITINAVCINILISVPIAQAIATPNFITMNSDMLEAARGLGNLFWRLKDVASVFRKNALKS